MPKKTVTFREDLIIRVVKKHSLIIEFLVKEKTKMEKVKNMFAEELGVDKSHLCFIYKDRFIAHDDTVETLGLQHRDEITVLSLEQVEPGVYDLVGLD
ncbi:hypothetical protein L5515_018987 [Caenorhabditis briggsae]|uniref:Ubiquitin-like domain-containing protein n=1 Tax=Caenorhabditis briggsae TaxID=6238 RepID=A0AAE9FIR6_CAEBR|nr:hypothetical protein L3Y34_013144 [Caenorhabditis briggsae]ULT84278.1 hypothetical protein L3Y34_013149 [Caenorhabditis briggsae]UMM43514.1 hypothetical protein L5515_018987 [Caenorhabditis briggsae]